MFLKSNSKVFVLFLVLKSKIKFLRKSSTQQKIKKNVIGTYVFSISHTCFISKKFIFVKSMT